VSGKDSVIKTTLTAGGAVHSKKESKTLEMIEEFSSSENQELKKIAEIAFHLYIENTKLANEVRELKDMMMHGGMPAFVCLNERPKKMLKKKKADASH
jgi:hypothetical protein